MASFRVDGVAVVGLAGCVPRDIERNLGHPVFGAGRDRDFIAATGVEERRMAGADVCTSDLCAPAAERLLWDLGWEKSDVDVLLLVSQTRDYILPPTSSVLQHRLGLATDCLCLDIPLGCSGFVYGLASLAALMSRGGLSHGLLCVGDTSSKTTSPHDHTTRPLFGDAVAVVACRASKEAPALYFDVGTDGSGWDDIIITAGGSRNPVTTDALTMRGCGEGAARRSACHLAMDGMDVFSFGITRAPESVRTLLARFSLSAETVDYFVLHQANLALNRVIARKLQLPDAKVPCSLRYFGNTSSATIPLTMLTAAREACRRRRTTWVLCGFGVGLSWASAHLETRGMVCPDLIEV